MVDTQFRVLSLRVRNPRTENGRLPQMKPSWALDLGLRHLTLVNVGIITAEVIVNSFKQNVPPQPPQQRGAKPVEKMPFNL